MAIKKKKADLKEFIKISKRHLPFDLIGHFLISAPSSDDDYFNKTLILLCSHDGNGSFGVIVNRHINDVNASAFAKNAPDTSLPLLEGGPVDSNTIFVLSVAKEAKMKFDTNPELSLYKNPEFYIHDFFTGKVDDEFMLVKGYCSWAPGQLEDELSQNAWLIMRPSFEAIFDKDYDNKWKKSLATLNIENISGFVPYSGHD